MGKEGVRKQGNFRKKRRGGGIQKEQVEVEKEVGKEMRRDWRR